MATEKEKKTETRAFTPASVLVDLGALSSALFGLGIICLFSSGGLRTAEVEAGELENGLVYFHCFSLNFLGEGVDGQSPGKKDFASFGDSLHHTVTKTVPAIYVDPESFFFLFFAAVLSHSQAEFHNFVAGVCKAYSAGILSYSADDGQLIVHGWHLQCVLGAPVPAQVARPR